jgi:hypothetical protein
LIVDFKFRSSSNQCCGVRDTRSRIVWMEPYQDWFRFLWLVQNFFGRIRIWTFLIRSASWSEGAC